MWIEDIRSPDKSSVQSRVSIASLTSSDENELGVGRLDATKEGNSLLERLLRLQRNEATAGATVGCSSTVELQQAKHYVCCGMCS